MSLSRLMLLVCFFASFFVALPVAQSAEESPATGEPAVENARQEITAESLAEWIRDLDANRFSSRQSASQKLAEAGKAAIDALSQAATGDSREASTRAIEILQKHFKSGNDELKAAAKTALEKIAKSENPAAAQRAQDALKPEPANIAGNGFNGGGIQIGGGAIQIQVQAVAGPGRQIKISNINGVKQIEADEDGRKVKITDDPNNGIKMEVTEKKDGKEETKKYEAKNAEELKQKEPEAYKIYDKYSNGAGGVKIQAIQIQGGFQPALPPNLPQNAPQNVPLQRLVPQRAIGVIQTPDTKQATQKMEEASKRLADATEQLRKLAEDSSQAEGIRKALNELEQAQKDLEQAKATLEKK